MGMDSISRSAVLLCGVSALMVPGVAMAQAARTADSDIVVTATRDTRSLKDVPMAVDITTGEEIEDLKIFDAKDISQLSPGLELSNNDGRANTTSLRGQSFNPDQGTAPAIQVYYNEIPSDAQFVYTAIYDIGQIEVLRGPQGLLRGLTAPAGSIIINTRRPSFTDIEGYAQATGTTREGFNVQGAVSVPLSDKVAVRIAALADGNRLNHVRNITRGGEYSHSRTESVRATLGFRPTDNFEAFLTYQYINARNNQFTQVVGSGNTPQRVYSEVFGTPSIFVPPNFGGGPFAVDTAVRSGPALTAADYAAVSDGVYQVNNKTHMLSLNTVWDLDFATLTAVFGRTRAKIITDRDTDTANAVPGYIQGSHVDVTYPIDTQELMLRSNNEEGLGWALGFFHHNQGGRALNQLSNDLFVYNVSPNALVQAPLGPNGSFITVPNKLPLFVDVVVPIKTETTSFNANLRYFSGPLKIEGGLRYSMVRKTQKTTISTSGFQNTPPTESIPVNLQDTAINPFSGGLTVSYAVSPETNVYASYGHSFRAPATGVSLPSGITGDLVRTVTEKTNSFEVGIKGSALDRRLNYTVSAYYQTVDGYLSRFEGIYWTSATDARGNGFFGFNYNGDAKIKGIEATLDGRITDNWDFGLAASYNHGRYSNALLPCNDYAGTGTPNQNGAPRVTGTGNVSYCRSNDRLAQLPDFSMTATTEIRFPVGEYTPFVRGLFSHRPGFYYQASNYNYQSRQLLNVFVGVKGPDDKWQIDVFARNLLDQKRITNISLGTGTISSILAGVGGGVYESGYRTVNTTAPREFGLTATMRF